MSGHANPTHPDVLEKWTFDVFCDRTVTAAEGKQVAARAESDLAGELRSIMRQIAASVTYLPSLDVPCALFLILPLLAGVMFLRDF